MVKIVLRRSARMDMKRKMMEQETEDAMGKKSKKNETYILFVKMKVFGVNMKIYVLQLNLTLKLLQWKKCRFP